MLNRYPIKTKVFFVWGFILLFSILGGFWYAQLQTPKTFSPEASSLVKKMTDNTKLEIKKPATPSLVVKPAEIEKPESMPLEFGSKASYDKYVASQKNPVSTTVTKTNIFADKKFRTGSTNTTDTTTQTPQDIDLKPMTITSTKVVCPDASTLAGCDYIGGDGLQKALDEAPAGSETNARRLLLKAGNYTRQTGNIYSVYLADGTKSSRQALYLAGGDEGKYPKYLRIESEVALGAVLDGAKSVGGEGIAVTAGRVDIEKMKITGLYSLNLPDGKYCWEKEYKNKLCANGIGVWIENTSKTILNNNEITGNNYGIVTLEETMSKITANKIIGNKASGIALQGNSKSEIANNEISGNNDGIVYHNDSVTKTTANKIISNKDNGIAVQDNSKSEIANNEISGNNYGIFTFGETISKITANKIIGNKAGIALQDKSNSEISNNVIANSTNSIVVSKNNTLIAKSNTVVNANTGLTIQNHIASGNQNVTFINNIVMNIKTGADNWADAGYGYFVGDSNAKQVVNIQDFRGNWSWQNEKDFGGFEKAPQWLTPDKLNRVADPMFVDPANGDFHLRPDSPARTAGVGGVEIGAYGKTSEVAPLPKPARQVSVLTYLTFDGTSAMLYECDGQKGPTQISECGAPTTHSLNLIRKDAPPGQSYAGLSNIVYKFDANQNVLLQSLLDKNSTKAWYRNCKFASGARVKFDSCEDWKEVDTSTFPLAGRKQIIGIEGFVEAKGFDGTSDSTYNQSMIALDGYTSYGRKCAVANGYINFNKCTGWDTVSLANIPLPAGNTGIFSEIDSWFTDASTYYQALVSNLGDKLYVRQCPKTNAGVLWDKCERFSGISMNTLVGAPANVSGIDSFSYEVRE